jgi:glycosyltransferase involved in cell wall biosynthesis
MLSDSGEAAYNINNDIQIYHLGLSQCNNRIARLQLYRSLIKNINKICKEKSIDIVVGTTHGINSILFFLRGKVKTIACEHLNYMAAPLASRILRKMTYPFLDAVVVLTASDAKHYSFHKNIKIIPNSLSFLTEKKSELTNKVVLAVGRLTYQKGFDLLISAISLIKSECNGWEVKIIGSGEDEDKLREQIKILHLGDIIRICPPTNAIIQEYLEASIFVLSSRYEGLPMVMIEAQSCGLPIVSFDCTEGPAEIVHHNEDGLLVENGDIEGLSKALLDLMQDQERRIRFGEKAIQSANTYKSENVFRLWDSLFSNL